MENFQLYRTNLYLGGQLKWDLIIDSNESNLYIKDFHLRPISDNISYTYKTDENLLNNSHQDNLKLYYSSIKGNFYSDGLDTEFNITWPTICKEGKVLNAYSNIYDMGCKRMKRYELYKKQFEFFCPLWIEHLNGDLSFKFNVSPVGSKRVLASKTLNISKKLNSQFSKTHNNFVIYFENYINTIGLSSGDDNLINISFKDLSSKVSGIDVTSGFESVKNCNLAKNLILIERPLLETDNMIIKSFSDNKIIAKQLFNFNFCFNLSDIVSDVIFDMLNGEKLKISVDVYLNGEILDKRDFYTNYENIDRSVKNTESKEKFNVLDYLKDYKYIDFINKNKFNQSICHWSLCNNNDYIFNVYDGFSGLCAEKLENGNYIYHENAHQYRDFPNLDGNSINIASNSLNWINTEVIKYWNSFYKYISNTEKNKKNGNYIYGNLFINGVKYKNIPKFESTDFVGLYLIGLHVTGNIFMDINNNLKRLKLIKIPVTNKLMIVRKDDLIMIISRDINNLSFKNFSKIMNDHKTTIYNFINKLSNNEHLDSYFNLGKEQQYLDVIYSILSGVVYPEIISFNEGLLYKNVVGPSINAAEIEYIKNPNNNNYVFRYDGKIKPSFVEKDNFLYFKDYVSDNRINGKSKLTESSYMKYMNTGFEPKYPSLDFCSIKKIENWDYKSLPYVNTSEHEKISVLNNIEYSWFEDNVCLLLKPEIHVTKENTKAGGYKYLSELLKEIIIEHYNTENAAEIEYILSKYSISSNWEYASLTNVDDYVYDITLTLK